MATLTTTLSSSAADLVVAEGQTAAFGFVASYTGTPSGSVIPDVKFTDRRVTLTGAPTANGSAAYDVKFKTNDFAPGGKTTTTGTFRLCADTACNTVYPGSTQQFTVTLDLRLKDWTTVQRDAGHTGYVAASYQTSDFAEAWSVSNPIGQLTPATVAARRGSVFLNLLQLLQSGNRLSTRAVSSVDGSTLWNYDLGSKGHYSGPSYNNGRVASMAMDISSGSLPMEVINADDGKFLRTVSYDSQFSNGGVPTPIGDDLYFQAGYFGNVVFGANVATGATLWRTDTTVSGRGFVHEGESVAADDSYVYYFGGGDLVVLTRGSGAFVQRIANPFFTGFGLSYFGSYYGAPILDGTGRIITFTDNRGPAQPRPLMAFSRSSTNPLWRTSNSYTGAPALRDGKLYAIRANSAIIDVIDVTTGNVQSSIDLGADKGELSSNVIVTASHLFVASNTATYALDLKQGSTPIVWSVQRGGPLALSPDNQLIIGTSAGYFGYKLF